jgi:hypothetical protein
MREITRSGDMRLRGCAHERLKLNSKWMMPDRPACVMSSFGRPKTQCHYFVIRSEKQVGLCILGLHGLVARLRGEHTTGSAPRINICLSPANTCPARYPLPHSASVFQRHVSITSIWVHFRPVCTATYFWPSAFPRQFRWGMFRNLFREKCIFCRWNLILLWQRKSLIVIFLVISPCNLMRG